MVAVADELDWGVDFVGNSGGKLPNSLEALRDSSLLFQALAFFFERSLHADVADDHQVPLWENVRDDRQVDWNDFAIRAANGELLV